MLNHIEYELVTFVTCDTFRTEINRSSYWPVYVGRGKEGGIKLETSTHFIPLSLSGYVYLKHTCHIDLPFDKHQQRQW